MDTPDASDLSFGCLTAPLAPAAAIDLRDHYEAVDWLALFAAHRLVGELHKPQAGRSENVAQVRLTMRIAQRRQQPYSGARMGFDGECKQSFGRQNRRNAGDSRRKLADIDEDVGSHDQIVARGLGTFPRQRGRKIGDDQSVVKAFALRLRDHGRRKIDADQSIHAEAESTTGEAGTAAEIEHCRKVHRPLVREHRRFDGLQQELRSAIAEALDEGGVITIGILIEQPAHVRFCQRRRGLAGAEAGELQPRAMIILRIEPSGLFEGGDRAGRVAEPVADGAEREPGSREAGCQFDRLHQNVGSAGKIAGGDMIERPFVTAVGDQIAGGDEERASLGHRVLAALQWMLIYETMRPEDILALTPAGICCRRGGFYIDPTRPVERALITHAHSDHARPGHRAVLATQETLDLMRLRYGENFAGSTQPVRYGERITLDGATVTFHPAGHVLGSAQIAVETAGLRIVASGDYKNVPDPTCAPFELVPCDVFITEATFALPVFRHGDPMGEIAKLLRSVAVFPERAHLVGAYSLGKAQRIIALLRAAGHRSPIYLHGAMEKITNYYEERGIELGPLHTVRGADKAALAGTITICPPSALNDLWTRRFPDPVNAFASGWMRVRARARQQGVALPLVISDHADWDGVTATIAATGASEIWVTHGQEDALVHWCGKRGLKARPLDIVGYGEEDEPAEQTSGEASE